VEENSYFQDALAHFAREAASGGAIRHLADMGYTVKQIRDKLDFPISYAQVQREVWEYFVKEGVILTEEPGSGKSVRKTRYVREYDRYGKVTFRQVPEEAEEAEYEKMAGWREHCVNSGEVMPLLLSLREENGEECSYASCDFGLLFHKESGRASSSREAKEVCQQAAEPEGLEEKQREYLLGLPWERRRVYHRLDGRMLEIVARLYKAGRYQGECYFLRTREKVLLCSKEAARKLQG